MPGLGLEPGEPAEPGEPDAPLEPGEPGEPGEPDEPWLPVCGHGVPVRGAAGVVFGADALGDGLDEVAADTELSDDGEPPDDREVAAAE